VITLSNQRALDTEAGIDSRDALLVGKEWIDVYLLDFGSETEEGGELYDDFGVFLFVESLLSAGALEHKVSDTL
jgi:hypothetical protein